MTTKEVDRPQGRMTLCTPELADEICGYIMLGVTMDDARLAAGISERAVYNWISRGTAELKRLEENPRARPRKREEPFVHFVQKLKSAKPKRKLRRLARIDKAGKEGDWRADAWYLSYVHRDEFHKKVHTEVSITPEQQIADMVRTGKVTREEVLQKWPLKAPEIFALLPETAGGSQHES